MRAAFSYVSSKRARACHPSRVLCTWILPGISLSIAKDIESFRMTKALQGATRHEGNVSHGGDDALHGSRVLSRQYQCTVALPCD